MSSHKKVFLKSLLICIAYLGVSYASAQNELYGSWQGKMRTASGGQYVFNLDILPATGRHGSLRGVAIHNRNGEQEVIELNGLLYYDQSIYLSDVLDRFTAGKDGRKVSKLQFLMKYESGSMVLDGHWQEYLDLRRYRKGRLVLRKRKSKA